MSSCITWAWPSNVNARPLILNTIDEVTDSIITIIIRSKLVRITHKRLRPRLQRNRSRIWHLCLAKFSAHRQQGPRCIWHFCCHLVGQDASTKPGRISKFMQFPMLQYQRYVIRCDKIFRHTNDLAPLSRTYLTVSKAATIRWLLVILPSFIGTLKSTLE